MSCWTCHVVFVTPGFAPRCYLLPCHWKNVKQQDTARQEPRHRGKDARWAPAPLGLTPNKGAEGCARRYVCRKLLESPNYLQKTDRPNSPASHIINALFASIKCDFIIFVSQTTRLQGRKSSSASFLPIMAVPRNVPEKGSFLLGMTLIATPTYPDKAPLLAKRHYLCNSTGTRCSGAGCPRPHREGCSALSSWEAPRDDKSLKMHCNKKRPVKSIHVHSVQTLKAF